MTTPISNRSRPQATQSRQPVQPRQQVQPRQPAPQRPPVQAQGRVQQQQSLLQRGQSFFEQNSGALLGLNTARSRVSNQVNLLRDAVRARSNPNAASLRPTGAAPGGMVQRALQRAGFPRPLLRRIQLASPAIGAGTAALRLPGQTITAARDIRNALRTGNAGDVDRAARSTRNALDSGRVISELGPRLRDTRNVVNRLAAQSPRAAQQLQRLARPVERLAESSAGRIATRLLARTATTTTARVAARAASRFVPGANIAIAAIDARDAYRALRDPNASIGRRTTAVITALGSAAAASNIPIVSQAGAIVSTLSDAIGAFFR